MKHIIHRWAEGSCSGRVAGRRRVSALSAAGLAALVILPGLLSAQLPTRVSGRILDQSTETPVVDAEVRLLGTSRVEVTDSGGFFRFSDVPPGTYRLEIRHLSYGVHTEEVQVQPETSLSLQVGISQEAIELDPLTVRVYTARDFRLRASGAGISEIPRDVLDAADMTGLNLGQVLEHRVPGVQVRESTALAGAPMCVEYRGARFGQFDGSCRSPAVYLDGVPVTNPSYLYENLDMGDIERMEVVPPAEAGVRFGTGALWGALVIETRIPGLRGDDEESFHIGPLRMGAFDWSQEPRPHQWWKVYAYAFLGNAVGLAVGVPLASECIEVVSPTYDRVTTECATLPTFGSALAGVAFPAIGSTLGAQWGGQTTLSRGDFVPLAVSAVMALIPGYALEVSSRRSDWEKTSMVAKAILAFGVPAAVTFSDRIFRKLRSPPDSDPGILGSH